MKKIKFNIKLILRSFLVVVSTILIIAVGIGVPGILINIKTSRTNLPRGVVDIAQINPYGADIIQRESDFLEAVNFYYTNGCYSGEMIRSTTRANRFGEIGIQAALSDEYGNSRVEFLDAYLDIMEYYFPESVPQNFHFVDYYCSTDNEVRYTYVYDDDSWFLFDNQTGAPIMGHLVIRSSYYCDVFSIATETVGLYQDYIGVTITDFECTESTSDGYRDSFEAYIFESSDNKFSVDFNGSSGWYFTPPRYNDDIWHETDMYEWTFDFMVDTY